MAAGPDAPPADALAEFEGLVQRRRAVRNFRPDPIPDPVLERLLDAARWAPSGYNLQPTHFYVVTDPALKQRLFEPCMKQRQVLDAHATVVFSGDRRVAANHFAAVLAAERAVGSISPEYEAMLRKYVPLAFGQGPLGLGWLWKAVLAPLMSLAMPLPSIPAVHKRYWLAKQVCLSAMVFMLAAEAAGLATVPMEGFDERRVKRALGIPRWHVVPVLAPVGYAADVKLKKSRLPLAGMTHWNRWR